MKNWLRAYGVEVGTLVVCGSICAGTLYSMYGGDVRAWSRRYLEPSQTPRGAVLVYQVESSAPLFGGDTLQDAVETRVAGIRALMGQPETPGGPILSWRQSRPLREQLPFDERQLCRGMAGADFRGADLRGIDFRGMNLSRCDFRGADLSGAQLDGAFLRDANFEGANLSDVDFREFSNLGFHLGRNVPGVRFQRSNFEGVFVGRGLLGADFREANLRNAVIYALNTEGMDIRGADLRGARFAYTDGDHNDPTLTYDDALASLIYDDMTRVEGLHLGAVVNTRLPFVQWAVARGALASFPREDPIRSQWALRHRENYNVICEGPTAVGALYGHVATLRQEIQTVTGLQYPEPAGWADVVQAIQALPTETRGPLKALLESTRGMDLQGLDLRGADLRGLDLGGAVFRGTALAGADLSDTVLERAVFVNTDLRNARFHGTSLKWATFQNSGLEGSEWRDCIASGVSMTEVSLTGTRLTCVDFSHANLKEVSFAGAELEDVSLSRALLEDIRFSDAVLRALDWRGGIARYSHFDGALIQENDFSGAVLHELAFSESAFGERSHWKDTILGPDQFSNLPSPRIISMVEGGGGRLEADSAVMSRIQGQRRHALLMKPPPRDTPVTGDTADRILETPAS